MEHEDDLDTRLLSDHLPDYLAGSATPETRAAIQRWVGDDPERARALDTLRRSFDLVRARSRTRPSIAAEARIERAVMDRIDVRDPALDVQRDVRRAASRSARHGHRWTPWIQWTGGALLGGIVLALAVGGTSIIRTKSAERPSAPQVYQTTVGQKARVRLADGSRMIVAPATSVIVLTDHIVVRGEAFFEIAPRLQRPFLVQTTNAIVQVLGTRFAVRRYDGEPNSRIVVEEGKVGLRPLGARGAGTAPRIVSANMLAQVTDSGVSVTTGIATRTYTGWIGGTLVFDKVPLRDVLVELGRAYGTRIRVDDSTLARKPMILEVAVSAQPLTQVLDMVGQVIDAKCTFDGQEYVLSPGYRKASIPKHLPPLQSEQQYGR